jgi:protein-disulfide isomerase
VLPLLDEAYISTGKVYFVYKEYPVVGGDVAYLGSLASQCAGAQDEFEAMHDWLFSNLDTWRADDAPDQLKAAAVELGLDSEAFDACLDNQAQRDLIVEDYREGQNYGVRGTPNFVINGHLVQGLLPFESMSAIIDALIVQSETGELPDTVATVTPTATPDTDFEEELVTARGAADAPITIVEFSDFQCPFCQRHYEQTLPKLIENYIDTGKVRYVFKDFPLTRLHPQAVEAALAAECAGEQDAYWEMHDKLYGEQPRWSGQQNATEVFSAFADELGLDVEAFDQCMEEQRYKDNISSNFQEGVNAGVTGTPAFFIEGQFLSGAQPFEVFQRIIESLLAQ